MLFHDLIGIQLLAFIKIFEHFPHQLCLVVAAWPWTTLSFTHLFFSCQVSCSHVSCYYVITRRKTTDANCHLRRLTLMMMARTQICKVIAPCLKWHQLIKLNKEFMVWEKWHMFNLLGTFGNWGPTSLPSLFTFALSKTTMSCEKIRIVDMIWWYLVKWRRIISALKR